MRRAARIDNNQENIVSALRMLPGVRVEVNHHDILVGFRGFTMWYEIKNEEQRSKKTGKIRKSAKRASQKILDGIWTGHRKYVTSIEEIVADITNHTIMLRRPDYITIELKKYLLEHEHDIDCGINDFGDLREIFTFIFKREPDGK